MINLYFSRQFVTFLITGGMAAAVNFGSRIIYNLWLDFSAAVIVAYITGMITAFFLAKAYVFTESKRTFRHSATLFTVVNIAAIVQTWAVSMVMAYYVLPKVGFDQFVHEIAHAAGVVFPVFTSYLGHKYWSFKE